MSSDKSLKKVTSFQALSSLLSFTFFVSMVVLLALLLSWIGYSTGSESHIEYHLIVRELVEHLEHHSEHRALVESALVEGAVGHNSTDLLFTEMYQFLDSVLTLSPTKDNGMLVPLWFYRYAVTAPGRELLRMSPVNDWIRRWLNQWAAYLDSPKSASGIKSWSDVIDLGADSEYIVPEGGFQSFNDFFCRNVKPGTRPIASSGDWSIISSPVDGILDFVVHDLSVNDPDHRFMVKDVEFSVLQILDGDKEAAAKYQHGTLLLLSLYFHSNSIFCALYSSSSLSLSLPGYNIGFLIGLSLFPDYHHYHSYCDSTVNSVRDVRSGYYFCFGNQNEQILNNCSLEDIPGIGLYGLSTPNDV